MFIWVIVRVGTVPWGALAVMLVSLGLQLVVCNRVVTMCHEVVYTLMEWS